MTLAERFNKLRFDITVRSILKTTVVVPGKTPFIALSMVQHRDVLSYLLALKSFARYLSPQRVVVVADPTLNAADRATLRAHVPHIEFREAAEFHQNGIPKGGTWERLTAIAEYSAHQYVVQLDADTVSTADLPEVRAAILSGKSFALGTDDIQPIEDADIAAQRAKEKSTTENHIQLLAESCLDRLASHGTYRYARACSGFSGFAPGTFDVAQLRRISLRMGELLGDRWAAWGTEQFTSNLLVCSSTGGHLLPHPRYCNPWRMTQSSIFLHLIGYTRFQTGLYARLASRVTLELQGL